MNIMVKWKKQLNNHLFTFSSIGEETQQESYKYLTVDEMKSLGDDSMPIDVTHDEGMKKSMERSQDYSNQVSIQLFCFRSSEFAFW